MKDYKPLLKAISRLSNDPITKVGCIITLNDEIVSVGYNRMQRGIPDLAVLWKRPTKYSVVQHAEMVAMENLKVVVRDRDLTGCMDMTMWITHQPCLECLKYLSEFGMQINYCEDYENMPESDKEEWKKLAKEITINQAK